MFDWLLRSNQERTDFEPFNGIKAIQAHLDQRARIEGYVNGKLLESLNVPTGCHAECLPGQWLHSENGKQCKDIGLLDSLCKSCEAFYAVATHAVLLTDMRKTEEARAALQDGQIFSDASEVFQENLARLHIG